LNHFAGTNQKKVVRTVFVVHTTLAGLNHYFRFEPEKSGSDQKFPVWTEFLWSGPDKVVQTGEN
jgi:hypothetical protein